MQMTLEKASKVQMIRAFSKLSLPSLLKTDYPSVGAITREYGIEQTEKVMAIVLHDLSASFDGALDPDDVEEITAEISSSILRNISLEGLYLTCRNIKKSDNYGKLNVNKVLKALEKHFNDLSDAVAQDNYNKHLSVKENRNSRRTIKDEMEEQYHKIKVDQALKSLKPKTTTK